MTNKDNNTLSLLDRTLIEIRNRSKFIGQFQLDKNRVRFFTNHQGNTRAFLILNTSGCRWARSSGGCSMCGFYTTSRPNIKQKEIKEQFNRAYNRLIKNKLLSHVYIFTCGSFFDDKEISPKLRLYIISKLSKINNLTFIGVESRPIYINYSAIKAVKKIIKNKIFSVSMGLESVTTKVLKYCVHKGYTFQDFKHSANLLKKAGVHVTVDLLLKPPFLTEKEAINDAVKSIEACKRLAVGQIYLSACFIEKDTLVWYLWKNNLYTPPWKWSLLEVAKKISHQGSPVAFGGFEAYPTPVKITSNCGKCDKLVEEVLNIYPNNHKIIKETEVYCDCIKKWRQEVEEINRDSLNKRVKKAIQYLNDKYNFFTL